MNSGTSSGHRDGGSNSATADNARVLPMNKRVVIFSSLSGVRRRNRRLLNCADSTKPAEFMPKNQP